MQADGQAIEEPAHAGQQHRILDHVKIVQDQNGWQRMTRLAPAIE